MQRTGQDAAFVLKNVPGTYAGLCQQALVLLRLHLPLKRQRHKRRHKQKIPSKKHSFILLVAT
jgi:hypothetical protein